MLITFEGGEGAGKTTLIEGIFSHLTREGKKVCKTRAPGGTKAGEMIRDLLLHQKAAPLSSRTELLLFLADRSEHVDKVILPALKRGEIVLCDRFNDSTVAYQGKGRNFGMQKVEDLCSFATDGLQPDLTIYLDLDPKLGLQRVSGEKDKIESEALTFHERIREAFHEIARLDPDRFRMIDATKPKDVVLREALELIYAARPSC